MYRNVLMGNVLKDCYYQRTSQQPRLFFQASDRSSIFSLDEPSVFKNLLLLGGPGSGKTNVMNQIISQTRTWHDKSREQSISLIFDTKGDFLNHPGFFRPGDYLIASDPAHRSQSVVWNLFEEILADGEDPACYEANAHEIANVYFHDRGSQTQPFFANAARDIFAATLIYFIRRRRDNPSDWADKLNNAYLVHFLLQYNACQIMKFLSIYPDFRGLSSYVGDGTSNQALGVLSELRSMLYECFPEAFASKAKPGQSYFSIRQAVRQKGNRAIFILYDLSAGEVLTPVYRLLIDLALKEALGRKSNGHVFLFLDELKLLPKLQHLEDALNFGRSKYVSIVAGLQSISQIYAAYNKEIGENILAGFGSIFAFHLNDSPSRKFVSDLFGCNLVSYQYETRSGSNIDRERDGHTVEDWDLISLETGHAVVGLASQSTPFCFFFSRDFI